MRNDDITQGLQDLLEHGHRLSEMSERLLKSARSSEHSALAQKLERLRDETQQHMETLREHAEQDQTRAQTGSGAQKKSALPKSVAREDAVGEDEVTEQSMESFPASDPPASY